MTGAAQRYAAIAKPGSLLSTESELPGLPRHGRGRCSGGGRRGLRGIQLWKTNQRSSAGTLDGLQCVYRKTRDVLREAFDETELVLDGTALGLGRLLRSGVGTRVSYRSLQKF